MKDWIIYEDNRGRERLCRKHTQAPNPEGNLWKYQVRAKRYVDTQNIWHKIRDGCSTITLDPQSPEFRNVTKEEVTAILLQAERWMY